MRGARAAISRASRDLRPALSSDPADAVPRQPDPAGPHRPDRDARILAAIRAAAQQRRRDQQLPRRHARIAPSPTARPAASIISSDSRGTITGRYTLNSESNRVAGSFPVLPVSEDVRAQQASIALRHEFAEYHRWRRALSFTRLRMFNVPETAFHVNVAQRARPRRSAHGPVQLRAAVLQRQQLLAGDGFAFAAAGRSAIICGTSPTSSRDPRGRHTWKTGFELLLYELNYLQSNLSRGQYNYTGVFTSADGSRRRQRRSARGFPARLSAANHAHQGLGPGIPAPDVRRRIAQDDWRVSRA